MKHLPAILLSATLALASTARAADYFMAPTGKDTNPGTLDQPFLTITRAQESAHPGDTVNMRGGKYNITDAQVTNRNGGNAIHVFEIAKSGTEKAPITYANYKDEVPIFDFAALKPNARVYAFYVTASWIRFQGFEVTGIQVTQTGHTQSECFENHGSNNIYDRLKMHDGMAIGYYALAGSNNLVINCDAWNNWDSVSEGGKGGNTDGFGCHVAKGGTGNVFRYCRSWYNSDDGYDCINCAESVTFDHCWAMYNGLDAKGASHGDGNGFKAGGYGATAPNRLPNPIPRNTVQFCLSVGNKSSGFYANHHTGGADWLNNTAFRNASNFNLLERDAQNGQRSDMPGPNAFMRNNLGYKGRAEVTNLNFEKSDIAGNYFNLGPRGTPLTITDDDFESLDENQLIQPRKPDGSLPDITFMHLKPGSKLIDAGTPILKKDQKKDEVRFPFSGPKPDLGAFEAPAPAAYKPAVVPPLLAPVTPTATLPSIFCCGDSTCKNQGLGADGVHSLQGWGTPIGTNATGWSSFFDPAKVTVKNVGHGGTTATSYYNADWSQAGGVLSQIKSGDYVIIVFGINSETNGGTADTVFADGFHSYGWYMKQMALEAAAKGAHPYFMTLTVRLLWTNPKATFADTGAILTQQAGYDPTQDRLSRSNSHIGWTQTVAAQIHIPVFSLTDYQVDLYQTMGRPQLINLYSDHNHTYATGAQLVSKCVLAGLKGFKNSPFTPLLSTAGKAVTAADPKYFTENELVPTRPQTVTPKRP